MKFVSREKILSMDNCTAAIEELLHRFGELKEDERVELPWKISQIPLKIYREQEVKIFTNYGK